MQPTVTAASLILFLTACSPGGNTPKIAEDQRDVMEQAGQVETVIGQGAEKHQEQADQQGQ